VCECTAKNNEGNKNDQFQEKSKRVIMSSSSSTLFDRINHLKLKLEHTTNPRRRKTLQRHIDILLEKENRRLTDLIEASLNRIGANLKAFDDRYRQLLTTQKTKL
jgi:hypothetical protein